jgi:hypothetical protein
MRFTVAALALAVASAAHAQQSNPISFDTISKSKSGQWADYAMTMKGQSQTLKMRYAVVDKSAKQLVLEAGSDTQMGKVTMKMQYSLGADGWSMARAMMQVGEQKQFMTPEQMKAGEIKKSDTPGQLVGTESVTVPAGKFEAKHYQRKATMGPAGEQTIDVWMSDKAMPTGLVKMTASNGIEAVLAATGNDAKPMVSFDVAGGAAGGAATGGSDQSTPATGSTNKPATSSKPQK